MKKQLILLALALVFTLKAQDTTKSKLPERRHEIGVSITVPIIIALGVTDYNERYSNLSYRYFLSEKHAIKPFVGVSTAFNTLDNPMGITSSNTSTVYLNNNTSTPSNFQAGIGYEYIMGKKKLKHVLGADFFYNNKFLREEVSYYREFDSTDVNGHTSRVQTKIDTGAYVKTNNFDKLGFNLSYSLRYEATKRWVIMASMTMTYKTYRRREDNQYSTVSDINMNGLISDISVFYRF